MTGAALTSSAAPVGAHLTREGHPQHMAVIYEHTQSKARRTYGGRIARLERSDDWQRVEDNEPQPLVVNVDGSDEPGVVKTADDSDVPGTSLDDVDTSSDGDDAGTSSDEYPLHKGGGNYELSDGTTVKGKEAATAAEAALNS